MSTPIRVEQALQTPLATNSLASARGRHDFANHAEVGWSKQSHGWRLTDTLVPDAGIRLRIVNEPKAVSRFTSNRGFRPVLFNEFREFRGPRMRSIRKQGMNQLVQFLSGNLVQIMARRFLALY